MWKIKTDSVKKKDFGMIILIAVLYVLSGFKHIVVMQYEAVTFLI